jgi:hypothetical protein
MHGVTGQEDDYTLTGAVRTIEALHYAVHLEVEVDVPTPGPVYVPTPGTERLTVVDSDLMWDLEPKDQTTETFAGWIVEIEIVGLEPIKFEDPPPQQYRPKALNAAVVWYRNRRARPPRSP